MLAYLVLGIAAVLEHGVELAVLYVVLIVLSFIAVAYSMCAKCPCRVHTCTHLWLGRLTRLLPQRTPGRYTFWDTTGSLFYIAGLHLLPQYWLWQNKARFILFWALALAAFLAGPLYTCKTCANQYCPFSRKEEATGDTTT